jgi:site-specific recombinase XerD
MNDQLVIDQTTQTVLTVPVYVSGENVPQTTPTQPPPLAQGRSLTVAHEPTIDEMLAQFAKWMRLDVADGNASPATLRSYWGDVRDHLVWLKEQGLLPVHADEDLLKGYRAHLTATYKISTAGRKFTSVRRFYDMAYQRGQLASNPAARIKSPADRTDEDERIKYLSRLALQKILVLSDEQYKHDANAKVKAMRDQAMLLLAMRHSLREIELARLNVENLALSADGENSTLRVFGKRSKWRTIHLVPQTQAAIEKWLMAHRLLHVTADAGDGISPAGTPLFVSLHWADNGHKRRGERMSTRGIRAMIDGYLSAAGAKAEGISGHALRHSFGTWSVYDGADLRAVSKEMGHSSIETTTKYSRVVDAMKSNPAKYMTFLEGSLSPDEVEAITAKKGRQTRDKRPKVIAHKKGTEKGMNNEE